MYKPTYCCDCGEKIERLSWNVLTNRRFCEFCETEHNLDTLLRKAAIVLLCLFGFFGIGSYFVSGNHLGEIAGSNESVDFSKGSATEKEDSDTLPARQNGNPPAVTNELAGNKEHTEVETKNDNEPRRLTLKNSPTQKVTSEPVYFCGAATKKGTPCSRRVKGGGRCWQHEGKEALLPEKELRINP